MPSSAKNWLPSCSVKEESKRRGLGNDWVEGDTYWCLKIEGLVFEADDVEDGLAYCVEEAMKLCVGHYVAILGAVMLDPAGEHCTKSV